MTTGAKAGARASRRKIIVYIATSMDGYIARSDGGVDWLNRPLPKGGYGMDAFARSIDTVLWGRKTYDFAVRMGGLGAYGNLKHYVFSRQPPSDPLSEVEFVSGPIPEFAAKLRARKGKNIWMIGEGIPLVAPHHRNIPLELISSRSFSDGVVHLNYTVRP
jgi:dihydrofolate reductase